MVEFEIQASTRQCAISGKELKPGDWVWSVLTDEEGRMVRKDYSVDTWQGPPAGAFSFWKFQIREKASSKETQKLDESQLQDWFERLEGQEEAKQQDKTLKAHLAHLIIHGCLHAQGYDHEIDRDAKKMEVIEIKLLKALGFANPYLNP